MHDYHIRIPVNEEEELRGAGEGIKNDKRRPSSLFSRTLLSAGFGQQRKALNARA